MSNSASEIKLSLYIVQRIISLLGNPDERNDHECQEEAQALRWTMEQSG